MDVHKKQNFIVSVHTRVRLLKPTWPAEPIFLTATLLSGSSTGRRRLVDYKLISQVMLN